METIKKQILDELGNIKLKTKKIDNPVFYKNSLKLLLNTKQTKYILPNPTDRDKLYDWEPPVLYPEYNGFFHSFDENNITKGDIPTTDYSEIMDGYGFSELFCDSRRWVVTPDYLKHVRLHKNDMGFLVNVYGLERHMIDKEMWEFGGYEPRIMEYNKDGAPDCSFAEPDNVTYTYIGKPAYQDETYIESCKDNVVTLAIDLPHEYYSGQLLKGNIYTWDIINKKYQIGGKDMEEINKMILEISATGFQEPLVMRIDEGCLTPIDNDTNIKLFLATYLNLPTIPAVLYMSNEDCMFNKYLEELHDIVHSDLWHNQQALDLINGIVMPYLFFENTEDADTEPYIRSGKHIAHKNRYPIMNPAGDEDHIHIYNRYFDPNSPEEDLHLPMTDEEFQAMVETNNNRLLEDLHKQLKEEDEEVIYRILRGEY